MNLAAQSRPSTLECLSSTLDPSQRTLTDWQIPPMSRGSRCPSTLQMRTTLRSSVSFAPQTGWNDLRGHARNLEPSAAERIGIVPRLHMTSQCCRLNRSQRASARCYRTIKSLVEPRSIPLPSRHQPRRSQRGVLLAKGRDAEGARLRRIPHLNTWIASTSRIPTLRAPASRQQLCVDTQHQSRRSTTSCQPPSS